jgi:hypothetical protein
VLNQAPTSSEVENDVLAIELVDENALPGLEQVDVDAVGIDDENAELEMSDLLRLPYEVQLQILQFMSYFLSYAATARLPRHLVMDFTIWMEVAHYWLKPENLSRLSKNTIAKTLQMITQAGRDHLLDLLDPKFQHIYHTNGLALMAAARCSDPHSIEVFLKRLAPTKYPYYIGEALKVVGDVGSPQLAKRLLTELMGKNPQGRDSQINHTFNLALENGHWAVIDTLVEQSGSVLDPYMLGKALVQAGKQNIAATVKAIIKHCVDKLSFAAKWSVKSTPGFLSSGLSVDALFANQYWFVRTPLTICLHQIGYPDTQTVEALAEKQETDTNAITELLGNLSLEEDQAPEQPGSIEPEPEKERKLKP